MYATFVNAILQKVHNYTRDEQYQYLAFVVTGIKINF